MLAASRKFRVLHREEMRVQRLRRLYNITDATYNALLDVQGGVCAICGKVPGRYRLAVDHQHDTGKVRGLLCGNCTVGLGNFRDDRELLLKADHYLSLHATVTQ
jgi:hypothetical protein